jgi:hypothetical protein
MKKELVHPVKQNKDTGTQIFFKTENESDDDDGQGEMACDKR